MAATDYPYLINLNRNHIVSAEHFEKRLQTMTNPTPSYTSASFFEHSLYFFATIITIIPTQLYDHCCRLVKPLLSSQ